MLDIRRGKPASPPLSQSQYLTGGQPNGMMASSMNGNGNGLDGNVLMQHLQQQQQQRTGNNGGNGAMTFNAQMQQRAMLGLMANSTNNSTKPQLSVHQHGSLLQMRSASTPLPFPLHHQSMEAMQLHSATGGVAGKPANPLASALNLCGLEDSSVEDIVAKSCRDILVEAASHSLKAVELANTLRARVGTEVLAHIRERWGGLLSLLERHPHVFRVERIPKNDLVTLVNPSAGLGGSMMMMGSNSEREAAGLSMRGFSTSPNNALGGQQQGVFHDRRSPPIHSSTSPGLLNGGDNYSVSSMGSSLAGYSHMLGNSGAFEREGAVSRCLHVGNVPSNMAESQLLRELERYGDVDCLKLGESCCLCMLLIVILIIIFFFYFFFIPISYHSLQSLLSSVTVSQRSRRFAFVSFRTVEQAISAKQRMSRVHPWKSAISFAHKESQSNSFGMSPSSSPALPTQQGFMQQQQMQQSLGNMHIHRDMNSQQLLLAQYLSTNATSNGKSPLQQHLDQLDDNNDAMNMAAVLAMARSQSAAPAMQSSSSFGGGGGNGSNGMYSDLQQPRPTKAVQPQQHRFGLTEDELAAMDNQDNNSNNNSNNMMFAPGASGLIRPASTGSSSSSSNNIGSSSAAAERARNLALHVSTADGENRDDELFLMMMQQQLAQEQKDVRQRQLMLDAKADELATQLHAMGGISSNDLGQKGNIHQLGQQQQQHTHSTPAGASQQSQDSEAVLRRLCDDTYVPTQPWPGHWEADAFYCSAVVAQLQQFGGTTTISKLRGFLRSRVNATDNIKSVPLKAMLSGYPAFFVVRGNAVALTPPLCQGIQQQQQSNPMYGSSSMMSQPPLMNNNNNNQHTSHLPMHGLQQQQQQQQQGSGGYNDYDSTSSMITSSNMGMGQGAVPGYNNVNNHIHNNHFSAMQQQMQMQIQSTNQEEQSLGYGDFMRSAAYQLKNNQSSQSLVTEARERAAADFSQGDNNISTNNNNNNNTNTLLDPTLAASLLSITSLENSAGNSFSYGM